MAQYTANVSWDLNGAPFRDGRYSRAHLWTFDGGATVRGSSSPYHVPFPMSDAAAVDPEEAFVAALSSCHMLCFLAIAAKRGFTVERYSDDAVGTMAKDAQGRLAITRVVLRPRVNYGGSPPDAGTSNAMHAEAHHECYIASSVKAEVLCEPATDG